MASVGQTQAAGVAPGGGVVLERRPAAGAMQLLGECSTSHCAHRSGHQAGVCALSHSSVQKPAFHFAFIRQPLFAEVPAEVYKVRTLDEFSSLTLSLKSVSRLLRASLAAALVFASLTRSAFVRARFPMQACQKKGARPATNCCFIFIRNSISFFCV